MKSFIQRCLQKKAPVIFLIGALLGPITGFSVEPGSALVIIDMQPAFITRGGHSEVPENKIKVQAILKAQVDAIEAAKNDDLPIIFMEYDAVLGLGERSTHPNLTNAVHGYEKTVVFQKTTDGMFDPGNRSVEALKDYLSKNAIKALIVLGANGGGCVRGSIAGAIENKYKVVAVQEGIADFNFAAFMYPYRYRWVFNDPLFSEVETVEEAFKSESNRCDLLLSSPRSAKAPQMRHGLSAGEAFAGHFSFESGKVD